MSRDTGRGKESLGRGVVALGDWKPTCHVVLRTKTSRKTRTVEDNNVSLESPDFPRLKDGCDIVGCVTTNCDDNVSCTSSSCEGEDSNGSEHGDGGGEEGG